MKCIRLLSALLLLCTVILSAGCGGPPEDTGPLKAAIIDQLYLRQPNQEFVEYAATQLQSLGLKVDIWQGDDITVDFYRKLPSMGYRFILFRVHSGTLLEVGDNNTVVELPYTYLFTAEEYSTTKYVTDQLADKVAYAIMEEGIPEVFAVNSEFIKSAKGDFNDTIILSMGCESYRHDDLMQAFMAKGAAVYIGWSEVVSLGHVDTVTRDLIGNYCSGNMTIEQGIIDANEVWGPDPYFGSYLKFFPIEMGRRTFKDILN